MTSRPDGFSRTTDATASPYGLLSWILSLPWVVERPYSLGTPGVRTFAIDCEPLAIRRLWLVTGLSHRPGIAVIVPSALGEHLEILRLARPVAPMPAGHVLAYLLDDVDPPDLERVILEAYGSALSSRATDLPESEDE